MQDSDWTVKTSAQQQLLSSQGLLLVTQLTTHVLQQLAKPLHLT